MVPSSTCTIEFFYKKPRVRICASGELQYNTCTAEILRKTYLWFFQKRWLFLARQFCIFFPCARFCKNVFFRKRACAHVLMHVLVRKSSTGGSEHMTCDVDDLLANSLIEWIRFCYNELDIILWCGYDWDEWWQVGHSYVVGSSPTHILSFLY